MNGSPSAEGYSVPEPDLLQQQRELLRALRQATARRAKAEADAEARCRADRETADAALNQDRQTATAQLVEARQAQELAQAALAQAGLQGLLEQTRPSPPVARPGADPAQELAHSVSVATKAPTIIQDSIEALQRWRDAAASRRRLLTAFAVVAILILAAAGFLGYRLWQSEQLYQSAVAALEAGQWDTAQAKLQQLVSVDSNYKDVQTLLRESYYRSAVAALEAGQWATAQTALQQLVSMDSSYKDAQTLLPESYYRSAVAALEAGQCDEARAELEQLLDVDDNYSDAQMLLCESYYRPALAYLEAEEWEKAKAELEVVFELDPTYKDIGAKLAEVEAQLVFGTGRDGDYLIGAGQVKYINDTCVYCALNGMPLTANALAAQHQVSIAAVEDAGRYEVGDEILIHQTQGSTGAGVYEFATIAAVDYVAKTLTLDRDLQHTYMQGGNCNQVGGNCFRAQVSKVPHYQNVTILNGGVLTCPAWGGNNLARGGICAFRVSGKLQVESGSLIDLRGKGFLGAAARGFATSISGESYDHGSVDLGYGCPSPISGDGATSSRDNQAGGGAGHATAGYGGSGGGCGGGGGYSYPSPPNPDLTTAFLGSGGGASSWFNGGRGGGIIFIFARETVLNGSVTANGENGQTADSDRCSVNDCTPDGGGAGSGGSILVVTSNSTLGNNLITATGGNGGAGFGGGYTGGNGSVGRIRIEYRSAVAALEAGQRDEAHAELEQLLDVDDNYSDAQTLLCESYYRPALAYLEAEEWEKAKAELEVVFELDPTYKDVGEKLAEVEAQLAKMGTRTPARSVVYEPVSLQSICNYKFSSDIRNPPTGDQVFAGIPFSIPTSGLNRFLTQNCGLSSFPTRGFVTVSIRNPIAVHVLIGGGYVRPKFSGKQVGRTVLHFSDGSTYEEVIIAGRNIREHWLAFDGGSINTITSPNCQTVWQGTTTGSPRTSLIDMCTIPLPESYQEKILTGMAFEDTSVATVDSVDPSLAIGGVTVARNEFP